MGDCITYIHLKNLEKILNLNVLKFLCQLEENCWWILMASCNQTRGKLQTCWVVTRLAPRSVASKHLHPGKLQTVVSRFQQITQFDVSGFKLTSVEKQSTGGNTMSPLPTHNQKGGGAHRCCLRARATLSRPSHALPKFVIYKTCDLCLGVPRPRRSSGKKTVEILARSPPRTQEVSSNKPKNLIGHFKLWKAWPKVQG